MNDEVKQAVDRLNWLRLDVSNIDRDAITAVLKALERETARADRAEAALRSISLFSRRQRVLVHKYEGDKVTETIGPKSDDPNWDYVIQTCERAGFGGTILRAMEANND